MLYNHEVWRDVRKRMLEAPVQVPSRRALSPKELLEKRRPYVWIFDPEEGDEEFERWTSSSGRTHSEGSRPSSAAGLSSAGGSRPTSRQALQRQSSMRSTRSTRSQLSVRIRGGSRQDGIAEEDFPFEDFPEVGSRRSLKNGKDGDSLRSLSKASRHSRLSSRLSKQLSAGGRLSTKGSRLSAMMEGDASSRPSSEGGSGTSKQLVRTGSGVLEARPRTPPEITAPRVERDPVDPLLLRGWARKHRVILPEVERYWGVFDECDVLATRTIGRGEFEKLLYGCTGSPKKIRLSRDQLWEFWQAADPEGRSEISFEEFLVFYKSNVRDVIGRLEYSSAPPPPRRRGSAESRRESLLSGGGSQLGSAAPSAAPLPEGEEEEEAAEGGLQLPAAVPEEEPEESVGSAVG